MKEVIMETNKISLKQMMSTKDAVAYLKELIKSFNDGKVVVQQGEDYVDLKTSEMVDIKVEAKVKKDKSKFSLELSWRSMPVEAVEPVTISSKAPEKTAPASKSDSQPKSEAEKKKAVPTVATSTSDKDEKIYFGKGSRKKKTAAKKPETAAAPSNKKSPAKKSAMPAESAAKK
jgi:amphi-Trp domain-containing protein